MFKNRSFKRKIVKSESSDEECKDDSDAVIDTVAQTKQHMIFLVDNLQYYLMADVLDTQISNLKMKLSKTKSFEDVKVYHDQFLTQVKKITILIGELKPCALRQIQWYSHNGLCLGYYCFLCSLDVNHYGNHCMLYKCDSFQHSNKAYCLEFKI